MIFGGIKNLFVVRIPTAPSSKPASAKSATDLGSVVPIPTVPTIACVLSALIPVK